MPEFLKLTPPDEARRIWFAALQPHLAVETIPTEEANGRVTAEAIHAPHPLPSFRRAAVDGFAVRAVDTYGASDSLPAYLQVIGEVPMGKAPSFSLSVGQSALIHTGGMLPEGADAVVMVEYTQTVKQGEVEIWRGVAAGENVLEVGEDVQTGQEVIPAGVRLRPAAVGGLLGLGILEVRVVRRPQVAVLSSGDEVLPPEAPLTPGAVRDINSYSLSALIETVGAQVSRGGVIPDTEAALREQIGAALQQADLVVVTAGSSASTRDLTAKVINQLGKPGVLVHGVSIRPGKPTILAVCDGKGVVGLPGNPVSALVIAKMFILPFLERLMGLPPARFTPIVPARLSLNVASQAGREDWVPVRLLADGAGFLAEPVPGKSNSIFTLVRADGLVRIPADATGLSAGELVEVHPL